MQLVLECTPRPVESITAAYQIAISAGAPLKDARCVKTWIQTIEEYCIKTLRISKMSSCRRTQDHCYFDP